MLALEGQFWMSSPAGEAAREGFLELRQDEF